MKKSEGCSSQDIRWIQQGLKISARSKQFNEMTSGYLTESGEIFRWDANLGSVQSSQLLSLSLSLTHTHTHTQKEKAITYLPWKFDQ